jgi:hypothetical protein
MSTSSSTCLTGLTTSRAIRPISAVVYILHYRQRTIRDDILKADVESGVSMRRKSIAIIANDILWSPVLVSYCVLDLFDS